MKFFAVAAFAGMAAAMTGTGTGVVHYTTEVVTAFTTYCPQPTVFAYNDKTYTITKATTVTITDCPNQACTIVKPVYTSVVVDCGGSGCNHKFSNGTEATATGVYTPHPSPGCSSAGCVANESESSLEGIVETSNAGQIAILSGAALAGVLAIAAAL